jgi:hypothetical protein
MGPPDFFEDVTDRGQRWIDRSSGKTWQPFYNYGAGCEATAGKLGPGHYRVSAALGNGPAPFGISQIIHLDGTVPESQVVIQLLAGPSLTVRAIDVQTQKSLALFQTMLVREDGFPVTRWSASPWALWSYQEDGWLRFNQLPPGRYRLEARRRAFYSDDPEYVLAEGPIDIRMSAGVDQTAVARLKAKALSPEALRQRWPFEVTGRVTDEQGQGLEGVSITAHCGIGTLLPTGRTESGPDGRYTLRFTGGWRTRDGDEWRVGLQAATISPGKHGYTEANLHRQGDLLMAERMPKPGERTGWKVDPGRVVLPDRPFSLDFVMVRGAIVKGRLVDAKNRPLADEQVDLTGARLPPSCSVLAETKTDADGRFQFENVPVGRAWWFHLAGHDGPKSRTVAFDQPVAHQVGLRLANPAGKVTLEVTELVKERQTAD